MKKDGFLYVFTIIIFVGAPVTGSMYLLYELFTTIQEKVFLTGSDFMLIQNGFVILNFVVLGLAFFTLIVCKIDKYTVSGFFTRAGDYTTDLCLQGIGVALGNRNCLSE